MRAPVLRRHLIVVGLVLAGVAAGCSRQGVLDGSGRQGRDTANLAVGLFVVAGVVFLVVVGLLLWSVVRSRRGPPGEDVVGEVGDERTGPGWLTIAGGVVLPVVVLAAVLVVAVPNISAVADTEAPLEVRVIGHRWWWELDYGDFTTANELHVPVGRRVRLEITSADVIHSFWVPSLNGKRDAIPGTVNQLVLEATDPGTFQGSCAEYCGIQHTNMDVVVVAEAQADYDRWYEDQRRDAPTPTDPQEVAGQQAFLGAACVYCHRVRGTNASSGFGPDLTHLMSRRTLGAGVLDNTPGNLAGWVLDAQHAKPGNAMPAFTFDGAQLQSLLAYLQSLE